MSTRVVSLADWREGKMRERRCAPRCEVCGRPGGYGASLLVCHPCRDVEALCGYDLGLAVAVVERLGPGLAAELATATVASARTRRRPPGGWPSRSLPVHA